MIVAKQDISEKAESEVRASTELLKANGWLHDVNLKTVITYSIRFSGPLPSKTARQVVGLIVDSHKKNSEEGAEYIYEDDAREQVKLIA